MTYTIVGTGNIAWFLGKKLSAAGHQCTGVYGRNPVAVQELAEVLLSDVWGDLEALKGKECDFCFLAVSDHAVEQIAAQLRFNHTVLMHTAGAVSLNVLTQASKDCAVLWPIYSIQKNSPPAHRNIPCGWEAYSPKAERYVQSAGHAFSDNLFETKEEQRKWLHLAAVYGNNFINHIVSVCEQICKENNLPFQAVYPIIEQTFEKIKNNSPKANQTGPAVRKDNTTIREHLQLLEPHKEWQRIYESITDSIQHS
jgi:predicted short-subunit dehydrogenase-like oxidoreductase (DUF2520 family)